MAVLGGAQEGSGKWGHDIRAAALRLPQSLDSQLGSFANRWFVCVWWFDWRRGRRWLWRLIWQRDRIIGCILR